MRDYKIKLNRQLSNYAKNRLSASSRGMFRDKSYEHILPLEERALNLVEPFRTAIQDHLSKSPSVKLHQYFHHLNSSQAFAFNLFYPYFSTPGAAPLLCRALGVEADVENWFFEHVPDDSEGTNVDVAWHGESGRWTYCEVKLSEAGFGVAREDSRHLEKLARIYAPRLKRLVSDTLLAPSVFFKNYQILRNISLLHDNAESRVLFLFPRENEVLGRQLSPVLEMVSEHVRPRVLVRHVEDVIQVLLEDLAADEGYRMHAKALTDKYVVAIDG